MADCTVLSVLCSELMRNLLVLFGVLVAIISVWTARSIAKKKQSADLLFASRGDSTLQAGHQHIRTYHGADDKNIRSLADPAKSETDEAVAIRYVLNHFETVSIGIQAGIFDELMIKHCWYSIVIQTHERTQPLISALRHHFQSPTVLQEFDWLAERWKKKPLVGKK